MRFQRAQQARRPAGVRCYGSAVRDPLHLDRTAAAYDAVRPGYPGPLIDAVLAEAGTVTETLELGCGSGQLTRSLATRGLKVHAIDIGAALLKRARANFAAYPQVRFEQADLRAWSPPRRCDLVASASAFHWLPTKQALALAADALPPGGTRAILRHDHPLPLTGFHRRAQAVYRQVFPADPGIAAMPSDEDRISAVSAQFALEPRLGPVTERTVRWSAHYDRDTYLKLLRTYSDQGSLPPDRWRTLSSGLAAIIDQEHGGNVERPYLTVAWIVHRRGTAMRAPGSRALHAEPLTSAEAGRCAPRWAGGWRADAWRCASQAG